MLTDNLIKLFKAHDVRKASHMVTDVPFWTRQFGLLAEANFQHIRGIQKVVLNQTKYLESYSNKTVPGKDEGRFFQQVKSLNRILSEQLGKLETDASQYRDIEASMKSFDDETDDTIYKLDHEYKMAMAKLTEQTQIVDTYKKRYHKLAFTTEKYEIKSKMAVKPDVIYNTQKKVEELNARIAAQIDKYSKHLDNWDTKLQALQKVADEYEIAYKLREKARAKLVLTSLQNSVDLTMAGNYAKRNAAFGLINERRFVQDTIIQRETINAPQLQFYTGESYTDATQTARGETDTKDRDKARNKEAKTLKGDESSRSHSGHINDQSNVFVVVRSYERQGINQLNLKAGEHVTQLLPPNDVGLAYGKVVHGILHKKKKGFYPVSHVVQLQIATDGSSNVSTISPAHRNLEDDDIPALSKRDRDVDVIPDGNDGGKKPDSEARRRRREGKKKAKNCGTIEPL